jgi:hypothetical protein
MPRRRSARGRKPSIGVAADKLTEIRRTLRSLGTEIVRLQQRLKSLDTYYSRQVQATAARSAKPSRRGPNVRDLAFDTLRRSKKALPIHVLAEKVMRARGKKSGQQFAQNLSVALGKDRRFKRVDRGVYAAR